MTRIRLFRVGDIVQFGMPGGSIGRIESENNYGGYYVRWVYGRDSRGDLMTALSSCKQEQLRAVSWEEYDRVCTRDGFGDSIRPLTFAKLREVNVRRCEEVFHKLHRWNPLEWAGAMCGEAGEAANIAKKIKRLDEADSAKDTPEECERLAAMLIVELADVVIYCDLLAAAIGKDLGAAVRAKFNVVSEERGSKERL